MKVLVRRAGRRDLDPIHARWLRLREAEAKADARFAPSKNADQVARDHRELILADPRTAFFVAEERGELVGFLHAQIEQNDPSYEVERYGRIVDVYVDDTRRRQGVGSALLRCCVEWFASLGMPEYHVRTPIAHPDAATFFERAGASVVSITLSARVD
jgi:GNAT superfamily N-acetyltransferase